jgi:hypothetical protein
MKKIFFSIVALAALAACSKSEVAYEPTGEIAFMAVAGNITKAPVDGDEYPTTLDLYVNAFTSAATDAPNYFTDIQFKHKENNKWGGVPSQYWPNETPLYFSGYSKSGTFTSASYVPSDDKLTINGYKPGEGTDLGANDLMWFPKTTEYTRETGKNGVTANMYHTCSWITFVIQGDATTGSSTSSYKITSLTMNKLDLTADVVCTGDANLTQNTLSDYVDWTSNEDQEEKYNVSVSTNATLASTYVAENNTAPKNIETGVADNAETSSINEANVGGNIVVIPQKPGSIDIAWTYKSTTNADIPDSATGLSLKLTTNENDVNNVWEPGKHYVYTITITANEILIAPAPVDWVPGTPGNVTVE